MGKKCALRSGTSQCSGGPVIFFSTSPPGWWHIKDFAMTVDLDFSRSNMEFAISQPKMVRLPRNKKQTYRLTSRAQCHHRVGPWPWPWPWIFKVKYRICYSSAKNGPIATKRKANISIKLWVSNVTLAMTLTLNFQGQIWNVLYLSQKLSVCHKTKSKHSDWTPGLKCDQWV